MAKVMKIKWLSQDAREAEVLLSDGVFSILCFGHPFNQAIGSTVAQPLHTLEAKYVVRAHNKEFSVEGEEGAFECKMTARVVDREENQIKIGEFTVELDTPFPGDIEVGDYVSFLCERIDIY